MNNVTTSDLLAAVNAAVVAHDEALAKLRCTVRTGGTNEAPPMRDRNFGGVVYGSWTVVPSAAGWHRWTTLGFGSRADVLAYNEAADAQDAAVAALAAHTAKAA